MLTAHELKQVIAATSDSQQAFADRVGVAQSQISRYLQTGLPQRMNVLVRKKIMQAARAAGIEPGSELSQLRARLDGLAPAERASAVREWLQQQDAGDAFSRAERARAAGLTAQELETWNDLARSGG